MPTEQAPMLSCGNASTGRCLVMYACDVDTQAVVSLLAASRAVFGLDYARVVAVALAVSRSSLDAD